jgi:elongation factor G
MCSLQVQAPTEFQGTVIGDLNRRKGVILNSEAEGDDTIMDSQVPPPLTTLAV